MISRDEVMPLLLAACPSFIEQWGQIESENFDDESGSRLDYLDAGDFIRHLVRLRIQNEIDEFPAVFDVIERLHAEGDHYVRELGTIGYLEGLQMRSVTDSGLDPEVEFRPRLGPISTEWWERINRFWEGDTSALQDAGPD